LRASLGHLFHFSHDGIQKRAAKKILFALSARQNTEGRLKIAQVNFTRRRTEVNSPNVDWLSYLRTQLTVFVGRVSLQRRKIFLALFSQNNFFRRKETLKELQLKGNLFDCSQILTVASFTYKQQKRVSKLFISKYFFSRAIFV